MTNPITRLLRRARRQSTQPAAAPRPAALDHLVELSVPAADGGPPVTARFALSELLTIDTLDELRERATEKLKATEARSNPDDFKGKPIIDRLTALGVKEDTSQYEDAGTTLYFNLGPALRKARARRGPR